MLASRSGGKNLYWQSDSVGSSLGSDIIIFSFENNVNCSHTHTRGFDNPFIRFPLHFHKKPTKINFSTDSKKNIV